jgi:hypothetical protein
VPDARAGIYHAYGLTVESPLLLPGGIRSRRRRPDIRLRPGGADHFGVARAALHAARRGADWFEWLRLPDGSAYLRWSGMFEFLVSSDGRLIHYLTHRGVSPESFATYLFGQVLSFSLLARGRDALHGTVSVVGDDAVAFVGDCGYGKSTLAAAMLARGYPVLTDDLVVLDEGRRGWTVHPGIPRLKLFPSAAKSVLGVVAPGTPMNGGTSKLVLPLAGQQVSAQPKTLRAIYVLDRPQRARPDGVRRPRVERLARGKALLEIVRAAFNLLVHDRDRLASQFVFASRLVASVPVCHLRYPRRLRALPAVCDVVLADLARRGVLPADGDEPRH